MIKVEEEEDPQGNTCTPYGLPVVSMTSGGGGGGGMLNRLLGLQLYDTAYDPFNPITIVKTTPDRG